MTEIELPAEAAPMSPELAFLIYRLTQISVLAEVQFTSKAPTDELVQLATQCGIHPVPTTRNQALKQLLRICPMVMKYTSGRPGLWGQSTFNDWLAAVLRDDREEAAVQLLRLQFS